MKSSLSIYVTWHPKFETGKDYAQFIFSTFCRDIEYPLSRGIGIPVYFRSLPPVGETTPIDIDFSESEKVAIVILVDDEMYNDDEWNIFVKKLSRNKAQNIRLFPVSLSKYAYDLDKKLKDLLFISLLEITNNNSKKELEKRKIKLRTELLHELSRMLLNMPTAEAKNQGPPPIKVFISHAKKDGETQAKRLRDYINTETKIKTFFDANDIGSGMELEKEIRKGIEAERSVLVVFQTDEYSTREWCRIETIVAKRYKCPVVVANAIRAGEKRSFPYLGNVPTVRWNNNFEEITSLALFQVLNNLFTREQLKKFVQLFGIEKSWEVYPISSSPELFNLLDIRKAVQQKKKNTKKALVIYPDPPLGNEEMALLEEFDDQIRFATPLLVLGLK